jgi:D-alanyl-D-alanine carboxypeptidase
VVLIAGACSSAGSDADPAANGKASSTTETTRVPVDQATLDAIADRYREACRSPGATVGLRTTAGTVLDAVSGEFAPGVGLDRDSQFLAGSVTKLFVAAVAYQLIESGDLAPGNTVDRFVPGWPRGDEMTVSMLLGHRSGMGDFGNDFSTQLRDLVLSDLGRAYRYDEVLDLIRDIPPVAEPGASYHYSNTNYIVLGAILQDLTDLSLGRLIRSRIIEPLGLTRTIYGPDELEAADAVVFHGLFDVAGTGVPVDIGTFPRTAALTVDPAGAGLFSSIPDLLTATHAFFATDGVLGPEQRSELADTVSTLTAADLLLDDRFVIHGHGGVSPGAQTIVAYDATHDVTVAVWCNRLDPGEHELLPSVVAAKDVLELVADR